MAKITVGLVGIGKLISPMAPHVANAGTPVHVFERDRSAADAPAPAHNGITLEDTAKAVARASRWNGLPLPIAAPSGRP